MPAHERFEELSSLALIGELSPAELAEWKSHLEECTSCRVRYSEYNELAEVHLPLGDRRPERSQPRLTNSVRENVLRRANDEGFRISPEAFGGRPGLARRIANRLEAPFWAILPRAAHLGISATLLTIVVLAGLAFRYNAVRNRQIASLTAELTRTQQDAGQSQSKLSEMTHVQSRVATNHEHLEQQLGDAAAHVTRLDLQHQQDLGAIHSLETRIEQLTSEDAAFAQRAASSEVELASLRKQLQEVRDGAADKEARLVAYQYEVTELSNQLKGQQSALEHEQQLLAAGRDIRDVMAARNLHIIDVHDMDSHGESRPFGRVFLTEGKRLIFYAYDLDAIKAKNASFQAWGQGEGGSPAAVNLGVLYLDDQAQSRWALKVEDPNLLNAINSIFVTVEPRGGVNKPTGKKLMYAYLRNPINHP